MKRPIQPSLPEFEEVASEKHSSTFIKNVGIGIHRWFRYSAGFSAEWVNDVLKKERENNRKTVLDPFLGSGTVVLEGEKNNYISYGIEAHPFVFRIAQAKISWRENYKQFIEFCNDILLDSKKIPGKSDEYPAIIKKCYPEEALVKLDSLKKALYKKQKSDGIWNLAWLALASILRECSPVGTAQWQYVLPNKKKAKTIDPYDAFTKKVMIIGEDILERQQQGIRGEAKIFLDDCRFCESILDNSIDLVITSPPYANNYDYADATRLEMSFFGEINGWGDLQKQVRKNLVRSCTQHVAGLKISLEELLENKILEPIIDEIKDVCWKLEKERKSHGGNKPYHQMIASYFSDLGAVWKALRRVTKKDSAICFVIGDSAPYGIYAPVDKWLGQLAEAVGFKGFYFEKIRDRNIKWKNRKHRVPLKEGRLWVRG